VFSLNSVWCTPTVVLPGSLEKTSPNSSSKAVKSSVGREVSWLSALDNRVLTTGTEGGSEVGAGHSSFSVTCDWIRTSAGMVLLLNSLQTGRGPILSVATGVRALLPKGLLCKGACTGFWPLPKHWQVSQLRQNFPMSRKMLGQKKCRNRILRVLYTPR